MAEGDGAGASQKEFLHHLGIAYGSLMELETQLLIAQGLGYLDGDRAETLLAQAAEVGRLTNGLSTAIRQEAASSSQ